MSQLTPNKPVILMILHNSWSQSDKQLESVQAISETLVLEQLESIMEWAILTFLMFLTFLNCPIGQVYLRRIEAAIKKIIVSWAHLNQRCNFATHHVTARNKKPWKDWTNLNKILIRTFSTCRIATWMMILFFITLKKPSKVTFQLR